ncbi:hypothetical protein JCM5350_006800 [Sporobolomyces pararoseus]
MSEELESWDSDPDLQLPPEGIRLPAHPIDSNSLDPLSPISSIPSDPPSAGDTQDFFSLLDSKLHDKAEGEGRNEKEDSLNSLTSTDSTVSSTGTLKGMMQDLTIVDIESSSCVTGNETKVENEAFVRSEEEEREKKPSKMQTIRLGSDLSKLLSSGVGISNVGRGKVTHLGSTPIGKAVEVGVGDWDQDLDFGDGSRVDAGEPQDTDPLRSSGTGGKRVEKKASWTSHLSIDDSDEEIEEKVSKDGQSLEVSIPTAETVAPLRQKISIDSFKDESEEVSDLDFDLPSTQSTFDLSPSLALNLRPSLNSLRSETAQSAPQHPTRESSNGSTSSIQTQIASPLSLPPLSIGPAPSRLSVISSHSNNTSAATTTDDEAGGGGRATEDSDAEFFQDLELPAYFLGGGGSHANGNCSGSRGRGGGTTTPPTSDGEFSFSEKSPSPNYKTSGSGFDQQQQQNKVDLQRLLKEKLELRGGRGLLFRTSSSGSVASPTKEQLDGLEKHREREEEEHEAGKELSLSQSKDQGSKAKDEEESWNAEDMRHRMRTISGVRARQAVLAKNSRNGAGGGGARRTNSFGGGKVPPLPSSSSSNAIARRPITARRSDTTPVETIPRVSVRSTLSRSGSTASVASQPTYLPSTKSSLPQIVRPSSAQSSHVGAASTTSTRKGPPPAPSSASRDRIRTRTMSLRTVGSQSDIRAPLSGRPRSGSGASSGQASSKSSSSAHSHPPRTASSPGPTPTLRLRRSSQHLRPSTAPASGRSIERKRSLQNLASISSEAQTPSRPASRQNSLRSPSPARSISQRPSFAAPTAASASRTRERVHSNPHPPPLAVVPASPVPSRILASKSGAGTGRLLQPTFSSASKDRSPSKQSTLVGTPSRPSNYHVSALRVPSQPLHLSRPLSLTRASSKKNTENYGDGSALDGFDDLPVSKEREKSLLSKPRTSSSHDSRPANARQSTGGPSARNHGQLQSKGKQVKSLVPVTSVSVSGLMGRKEGEKAREKEKDKAGKKKKREPHLIRHLGAISSAPKVQGEMTYNPILQRWEGNESILREFDKVLSTSTRPALISPFSSTLGSPARSGFSSPTLIENDSINSQFDLPPRVPNESTKASSGGSRGGVKVVGDMVFDPSTCSWHAIAGPEGEDELELDWGDVADDEEGGEGDGWERGERERMLKNRASFVLSEGEEGSSEEEVNGKKGKMTKRGIWRESKRAEERCKEEMKGWITYEEEGEEEDRSWLLELRALIMDSR